MDLLIGDHFEWRVPVDDRNTLSVSWFFTPLPREQSEFVQDAIPTWRGPIKDANGRWITSHIINQDIVAWVGQGDIADRTKERLGTSDRGIAMIRKRFLEELEKLERGEDPKGIIRDPAIARRVELPTPAVGPGKGPALPRKDYVADKWFARRLNDFPWHFGQPEDVLHQFREAVGLTDPLPHE
jgi:5,5'-dehydrodivanillate O-demethylase